MRLRFITVMLVVLTILPGMTCIYNTPYYLRNLSTDTVVVKLDYLSGYDWKKDRSTNSSWSLPLRRPLSGEKDFTTEMSSFNDSSALVQLVPGLVQFNIPPGSMVRVGNNLFHVADTLHVSSHSVNRQLYYDRERRNLLTSDLITGKTGKTRLRSRGLAKSIRYFIDIK